MATFKTSSEIASAARLIGEEKTIEYMARAGFDAYDFSMFAMAKYDKPSGTLIDTGHPLTGREYLAYARRLKHVADECGIVCNQSHAPFPTSAPPVRDRLLWAIECTAEAGGKYCIIHPFNNGTAQENAEFYSTLIPYARDCGVIIATENMWNWDKTVDHAVDAACSSPRSFVEHIDILDGQICACLDIGHAEMYGLGTSAPEMIEALGHRLLALHLHDNNQKRDQHKIPFSGSIDFSRVVASLKRIGYKGHMTLEADMHLKDYSADNVYDGIRELADVARRLADMMEAE